MMNERIPKYKSIKYAFIGNINVPNSNERTEGRKSDNEWVKLILCYLFYPNVSVYLRACVQSNQFYKFSKAYSYPLFYMYVYFDVIGIFWSEKCLGYICFSSVLYSNVIILKYFFLYSFVLSSSIGYAGSAQFQTVEFYRIVEKKTMIVDVCVFGFEYSFTRHA